MVQEREPKAGPARRRGLEWSALALILAVGLALYMRPEPMAPMDGRDVPVAEQAAPVSEQPSSNADRAEADIDRQETASAPATASPAETDDAQSPDIASAELQRDVAEDATAEDGVDPGAAGDAATRPPHPMIEEVRLEADGVLVVAGRAAPGDEVGVLVDGEEVGSGRADSNGAFAAIGFLAQSNRAQILTLRARSAEGERTSRDEVILAPRRQPVQADTAIAQTPPPSTSEASGPSGGQPDPDTGRGASQVAALNDALTEEAVTGEIAEAPAGADAGEASGTPEAPEPRAQDEAATGPPQVAILRSSEQGVTLIQPALPDSAVVALDTIGYSDGGAVELAGRATSGDREVRIYLDNRPVARLPLDEDGTWRGEVPDVDTGVYTLRVDAVNAQGEVTSRVETPFKRESATALAAATGSGSGGSVRAVTVQAGDTLWAIARDRYGDGVLYLRVFEANRAAIRNPDLIYPGQVFDLPPG